MEGERIRLRPLEKADLHHLHRWMNDQEVMSWARFSPDHMTSLSALEKEYEKELAGEDAGRTTFIVEDKVLKKPIGWATARTWDRKHVSADIGVAFGEKEYWGKGFGTEVMELFLTILFDHRGWHRVELWTLAENERAIGLAEKMGFRREGLEREAAYYGGGYHDVATMALLKSEWDARRMSADAGPATKPV